MKLLFLGYDGMRITRFAFPEAKHKRPCKKGKTWLCTLDEGDQGWEVHEQLILAIRVSLALRGPQELEGHEVIYTNTSQSLQGLQRVGHSSALSQS